MKVPQANLRLMGHVLDAHDLFLLGVMKNGRDGLGIMINAHGNLKHHIFTLFRVFELAHHESALTFGVSFCEFNVGARVFLWWS